MNPFFFGTSDRQLFGAHDPPPGSANRGVVFCHAWAREYLLAYPTVRHLARRLSEAGWHALRFDYSGTGDSAGDDVDADENAWLGDIETAVEELKDIGQLSRIALVGMRYGAVLAAQVAARRPDIERLALWDPVLDGHAYVGGGAGPDREATGGTVEVAGARLSARLWSQICETTLEKYGGDLPETLIVNTLEDPDAYAPLCTHLTEQGIACAQQHVPDVQVWREEWGTGGVGMAVTAVARVVEWMA